MVSDDIRALKLTLSRDKRYMRLKNAFDTLPMFSIDTSALTDEVMLLNSMRQVRKLNSTSPDFIDRVIKAGLKDQSYRSRMAEILSESVRIRRTVETALDSFTDYAMTRFKDQLSSYRSLSERQSLLRSLLTTEYKYLHDILTLQTVIQTLLEDIDKAHWTLKTIVEAVKLIYTPERKLS